MVTVPHIKASDGVELSYSTQGPSGTPVVLLHGWACNSGDWSWTVDSLCAAHQVIAPDLRGHGGSSTLADDFSAHRFALDVVELLDHLGLDRVILVGHSLGGLIASEVAIRWPDRVRGLVAIDPAYGLASNATPISELVAAFRGDACYESVVAAFGMLEGPDTPDFLRALHRFNAVATPAPVIAEAVAAMVNDDGWYGQTAEELTARLCPILSVFRDTRHARWDELTFKHELSATATWPGTGHWLHQEDPHRMAGLVNPWIESLP